MSACLDEIIIVSLPCDQSARSTWLVVFHLLTCIYVCIFVENKSVVKRFAQRYTYINYESG